MRRLRLAGDLGARILRQMALRIAVVICAVTVLSYWHVYRSVTDSGLATLAQYVHERGERESQRFLLAEDNLKLLMSAFLQQRARAGDGPLDPPLEAEFWSAFERSPDGAIRRRKGFDADLEPSAFIAARVGADAGVQREAMAMLHLVRDFGRAWMNRFASGFLASMDGIAATHLPGTDWYTEVPADVDFASYPWVRIAQPDLNPSRGPVWTSIWYDWVIRRFAVTCILPADVDGRFRYYAGISVLLDDIMTRAREASLAGTHNVIFRADGRLVSHPDDAIMTALRNAKGDFSIQASGNAHLQAAYRAVVEAKATGVIALDGFDEYLGVARIAGPDWYFVTVLPRKVLSATAESTAQMVLWLGLAALLMELAIVGWILRREVAQPLGRVVERLAAFGRGDWTARLQVSGDDELARVGSAFNDMARALQQQQDESRRHAASLEGKVQERTRQLQEQDRAKTRFLAAASHDLRQPIQSAALFVDSLKHSSLDARQQETVALLDQSIHSVRELLDALLDISKLDAGAVRAQRVPVSLRMLVSGLGAEFAGRAAAQGLSFRTRLPASEVLLESDPHLLTTILRNLLANALAYTQRGGILLAVRRRGDALVLQVWDTGIGIPEDQVERIYEEFYQVDNPNRDRSKGFGIGLAIAQRAARLLDGRLACTSTPGRGTRFELRLPLTMATRALPAPAPQRSPRASLGGTTWIVVEDDRLASESLVRWLEDAGCEVRSFSSAEAALRDERLAQADGYITDFRLPGADGLAFLAAVQARTAGAMCGIVITGDTSADFIERATRSGWRVLFKPVDPEVLDAALRECATTPARSVAPA